MAHRIFISRNHPLHRLTAFGTLVFDGEIMLNASIELMFWHTVLMQHGQAELAGDLLLASDLRGRIESVTHWVKSHGFTSMSTYWTLHAYRMFKDIVIDQMQQPDSLFREAFIAAISGYSQPELIEFIYCGNDYTWACGLRASSAPAYDWYPGANLTGGVYTEVLGMYLRGNYTPDYSVHDYFTLSREPYPYYSHTVAIISDSQCRQLVHVEGGLVVPVSGGTFLEIGAALDELNITPYSYRVLVINAGVNDAQNEPESWAYLWEKFYEVLKPIIDMPNGPAILVSLGVPHPSVPQLRNHSDYIQSCLAGTSVWCLNWFNEPDVTFVTANNQLVQRFFAPPDFFHINHAGMSLMWRFWCYQIGCLNSVPYKISPDIYDQV